MPDDLAAVNAPTGRGRRRHPPELLPFTGYFRQRRSNKNITFPYEQYAKHFVLGVVYSRIDELDDERRVYTLDELQNIVSVVKNFTFLLQEKWRIAGDQPGSGNTKNIGSVRSIPMLVAGEGPFAAYGESVFDDFWMNYLTLDMARAIESDVPYSNLAGYFKWRDRGRLNSSGIDDDRGAMV